MKLCWNTAHSIIHCLGSSLGQRLYGRRSQRNLLAFRKFSDPWFKMVQITSGVLSGRGSDWLPVWVLHALSWSTAEVGTPPSVFSGGAGAVSGLLGALCFWVRGTWPPGQVFLSVAPCGVLLLEAVGLVLFGLLLIWVPLEAFCVFFSFDTSLGPFFFTLWKKLAQSSWKSSSDSSIIWRVWRLSGWSSEKWGSIWGRVHRWESEPKCEPGQASFTLEASLWFLAASHCSTWRVCTVEQDVLFPPSIMISNVFLGLPGGPVDKNPPANAGDMGLIPSLGRSHVLQSNLAHGPLLSPHAATTEAREPRACVLE